MTSGSGLIVGKNVPVNQRRSGEREHRRQIAEAANYANAAAFTPETLLDEISAPVSLDVSLLDLGVSLEVTPFIPARAHVFFIGQAEFVDTAELAIEIQENGVAVTGLALGAVAGTVLAVPIQILRDLQPNTTYEYTVEALESGGNITIASGGTLTVRIEARRLPT